jgi:hypothetical protein
MVQRRDGRAATVVVTKARRKVPGWANSRLKNLKVGIFWWKEKELANGLHKDLGRDWKWVAENFFSNSFQRFRIQIKGFK